MLSLRQTIADDLRTQISTGRLKPGERLPSEVQLAARYTVSTPTLRNALAVLQAEGLIEKIHGKGNFVRRRLRRLMYTGGALTFLDPAVHETVRTSQLQAQGALSALLKVPQRTPLTEFLWISHEGESPHSLARIYIPRDLAPAEPPWCRHGKAELRTPLAEIQEKVSARLPTSEEASTLRISTALAVLAITRVSTDATGRVVEAALLVLPGDRADAIFTFQHATNEERTEV
ncbi:GntR family transcriptional regulator [Streptomyces sp. FIT100]|uniref:GntR family transcriptional regulator n=1 Tax=Streptomyces sp. FIT100 TaxID=2837956 RepID=UPI0021C73949|nr:GntR family transcriptional regulator [Streptomyces sp. FIT100]UUN27893.1 GntR family transcriptional regulator [Streptomyces sp. FIT100]